MNDKSVFNEYEQMSIMKKKKVNKYESSHVHFSMKVNKLRK